MNVLIAGTCVNQLHSLQPGDSTLCGSQLTIRREHGTETVFIYRHVRDIIAYK